MLNKDFSGMTFQDVKSAIIDHYNNSPSFKDYNFTGSRLNTLIDGLAYAALYQGTFANAALFESFLSTATQRGPVVLLAQNLGYVPASVRASSIKLALELTYSQSGPKPLSAKIPFGFKFFGSLGDSKFEFVTFKESILTKNSLDLYTGSIDAVQGKIVRQQYIWATDSRLFIKDQTIDRRYIRVRVGGIEYRKAENAARVSPTDAVYYFRETIEGWTEIYFGSGQLEIIPGQPDLQSYVGGLRPSVGQALVVEFVSTKGAQANGIKSLKAVDSVANFDIKITTEDGIVTSGGGDKEDIERIRTVAPKVYESQGRCVTAQDYEAKILEEFGAIVDAIRCWGDNTKPGYAFVAIKPVGSLALNKAQIDTIEEYLKRYNVVTISPKIVTPDYLFVEHTIGVDYKVTELNISEDELYTGVLQSIKRYYDENIVAFSSSFHVSKLLSYIDGTNSAVLGSECVIRLVKEQEDNYKTPSSGLNYLNRIIPRTLTSSDIIYQDGDLIEKLSLKGTESGKILIGPFVTAAAPVPEYMGNDFDRGPIGKYYPVGTISASSGNFLYNLGALGISETLFLPSLVRIYTNPAETDIYTKNGSLIVYEPLLRPDYTKLELTTIL